MIRAKKLLLILACAFSFVLTIGTTKVSAEDEDKVCECGSTKYTTLEEAFTAAEAAADASGTTIKMLQDANLASYITVSGGTVSSPITLDLNGTTVAGEGAYVFYVTEGSYFKVTDSKATGGGTIKQDTSQSNIVTGILNKGNFVLEKGNIYNCGSFYNKDRITGDVNIGNRFVGGGVTNYGTFTMSGGCISTNVSYRGGGVYNCGTFTMNGGQIDSCQANYGGGVYNCNTFVMTGSSSINTCNAWLDDDGHAGDGAGIYNHNGTNYAGDAVDAIFTMQDNSLITGCGAYGNGGGICNTNDSGKSAICDLKGGSITSCSAGTEGGGVYNSGIFDDMHSMCLYQVKVSGTINVSGNTADGKRNNIYVKDEGVGLTTFTLGEVLESSGNVGVHNGNDAAHHNIGAYVNTSSRYAINGTIFCDTLEDTVAVPIGDQIYWAPNVAKIGTNSYATLADAVTAALGQTATITLINDVVVPGSGINITSGNITIDLNNHTITHDGNRNSLGNNSAFYVSGSGTSLTITDNSTAKRGTIKAKSAGDSTRAFVVKESAKFYLWGGIIEGFGTESSSGGAVYANDAYVIDVYGATIQNCIGSEGGAIYLYRSKLIMKGDFKITNCKAIRDTSDPNSGYGGAIYVSNSTITDESSTLSGVISNCEADCGGAIYIESYNSSGNFIVNGTTITECSATRYGGGIFVNAGSADLKSGSITKCTAGIQGGGVYVKSIVENDIIIKIYNFSLSGIEIKNNKTLTSTVASGVYGGGVYSDRPVNLTGATIVTDNTAPKGASGAYTDDNIAFYYDFSLGYVKLLDGFTGNVGVSIMPAPTAEREYFGYTTGSTVTNADKIRVDGAHFVGALSDSGQSLMTEYEKYTFEFDTKGHGTAPANQTVKYSFAATEPTAPTESGYYFEGWYKEAECVNAWNFTTDKVVADTTVYAKWSVIVAVPVAATGLKYTGNSQTGVATGAGFTLTGTASAVNAGSYSVVASLEADCRWADESLTNKTIIWSIEQRDLTDVSLDDIPEQTYSGHAIEPELKFTYGGSYTLVKDTDYTVSYTDNTEIGTAKVTIIGVGNFKGTKEKNFEINKKVTLPASVELIYSGAEQVGVAEGAGYTLIGNTKAKNVGTYTVTVALTDDYVWADGSVATGRAITWKIKQFNLTDDNVADTAAQRYTGSEIKPEPAVTINGVRLVKNVDFTYEYLNNTSEGTATVTVVGTGNCAGTVSKSFTISKSSSGSGSYTPNPYIPVYVDDGSETAKKDDTGKNTAVSAEEGAKANPEAVFTAIDPETGKEAEFYADKNGNVVKNKVVTLKDGSKIFTTETGAIAKKSIVTSSSGRQYYADKNGKLVKETVVKVDGKRYYTGKTGVIIKNKLVTDKSGNKYYCTEDGSLATSKIVTSSSGKQYYADKNGKLVKNTVVKVNGKRYYTGKTGVISKNKLVTDKKGNKHYCTADGSFIRSKWITVDGIQYYANKYGRIIKTR